MHELEVFVAKRCPRGLAAVVVLGLVSCGTHPSTPSSGTSTASGAGPPPAAAAQPAPPGGDASTPAAPPGARPSDAELAGLTRANNAFAFALWSKLASPSGDFAYSPLSVELALAMTWLGARGQTAAQMKQVLGFDVTAADAADLAGRYTRSLGGPVTIRAANRLFGDKTYRFEPSFLDASARYFGAPLEALDFRRAVEASRARINQWVAAETRDRIKDLIPAGGVSADTRLVLVNAIYFLADWDRPFTKQATRPAPFHTSATAQHDVPTMHQRLHASFTEDDAASVIDLPYVGGGFAMTIVLPKQIDGVAAIERGLSAQRFAAWIAAESTADVDLALPRFTIDPPGAVDLRTALEGLGMPDAFECRKADFTGIARPAGELCITHVFHKAFVKVDEKGTEAAAATAVTVTRSAVPGGQPKQFHADHPFLFFLRDAGSNTILFAGRVADPVAK